MSYKHTASDGGLRSFEGVLRSGKPITSAVRDLSLEKSGKGKVTVTYADGCIYTLECDRTETDDSITLTNISETWNNGMETIKLGGG